VTQPIFGDVARFNAVTGVFEAATYIQLAPGIVLMTHNAAPTDAVQGTGYGTAAKDALYLKTGAPAAVYKQTNVDATLPTWSAIAAQPAASGVDAPQDGVTAGTTDDYYHRTSNNSLYRCTDGDTDTWELVTSINGAGAPTNGTRGTGYGYAGKGSILLDSDTPSVYKCTGTTALPTWTAV
jgi:hypothetical protein